MTQAISLFIVLCGLWLLLSGVFQWLLLTLGLISCAGVVAIAMRMDVVDHEGHPVHLRFAQLAAYWVWLLWEIIKANLDVARLILSPNLRISPTMVHVQSTQHSELGQVIYANSITLTPGTVSMSLDTGSVEVHALTEQAAHTLMQGEMDRRVTAVEHATRGPRNPC